MKQMIIGLAAVLSLAAGSVDAQEELSKKVVINPEMVFIPSGFDDNDNAQMVLWGHYTSTCFSYAPPKVDVDVAKKTISITNYSISHEFGETICADMLVDYTTTIDLGSMMEGEYAVHVFEDGATPGFKKVGKVSIAEAPTPQQDNVPYAPATNVTVDEKFETLTLTGRRTNTCMQIPAEAKVNAVPGSVFEVLPIMKLENTGCAEINEPFKMTARLPKMTKGAKLFHVRTLGGQSLNRVVEVY